MKKFFLISVLLLLFFSCLCSAQLNERTHLIINDNCATLAVSTTSDTTICISQSATITAYVTGGTPPYTYQWSDFENTASITVYPFVTTQYIVDITDSAGCTIESQPILINVNPLLNIVVSGPPYVCTGSLAALSALGAGGNGGPYTYVWSNGDTTADISIVVTQDTTLYVTLNDSCSPPVQTSVTVLAMICTGVETLSGETSEVKIFPNPVENEFSIRGTEGKGVAILSDVTGKEIFRQKTFEGKTKLNT